MSQDDKSQNREDTEYAVMCADGQVCHRGWQRGPREAVEIAVELFDSAVYDCGPHRLVQRSVTPWEPAL